jgi:hypothetical protein
MIENLALDSCVSEFPCLLYALTTWRMQQPWLASRPHSLKSKTGSNLHLDDA